MVLAAAYLELAFELSCEWHEARSRSELVAAALSGLQRLVPADAIGWNEIGLDAGANRFVVDPPDYMRDQVVATLDQLIDGHPVVDYYTRTGDGRPIAISDFMSTREFRRSTLYGEVYRDLETEDQLAIAVETASSITGVAFSRGARSFRASERAVLDLVRPHLASAHANLQALEAARTRLDALEQGLEEGAHGLAFVRAGRIEPASRFGAELLCRWFDGREPPLPTPGESIVVHRPHARLTLRLAGAGSLLLLDETLLVPEPERARALGLTARETEVLALAARGLTNLEISRELFISARTVGKHLEHVYGKLGVNSRGDAVARLLGR